ncbi:MAG: sodium/proline symporter [Candidatus Hydrogenedentes bacterium]|nr:sodium/proline symporter [Candidatus Hydrogenedentota bacterium]
MEEYRNLIILVSVALYMGSCVGIGVWALRKTKSTQDFFMAGRHLGVMVTAMAVFSSTLSGFGFVGGPGLVYRMGISSLWMIVCASIGYCLSFYLLAKRIRLFAELRETVSLPDAVAARYNSEGTRFFTAVAILLGVFGYLGTQILAMARVLTQILGNIDWWPENWAALHVCMIISVAVLVFYCVTGGILASVYTDMIQGSVMIIAAVLVFFAAISAVDGGMIGTVTTIMKDDPEAMSPWGTLGVLGCLSWYFLFALGGAGQPHVITKLMMNKKISDIKHIMPVTILGYTVSALLWISIGLAMRALVLQGTHDPLAVADDAAPAFLQNYAHPLLAGIVFAGLFAAIMSTADGFLNIGAAAVVHDIPKALGLRALKNELFWARTVTLIIAIVSAILAYILDSRGDLVALIGAFGWGTFAAALVPTVAIGFNWKRATSTAAITAIVASLAVNFGIKLFDIRVPYNIDGGAIALIVSLTLFFTISLASKPPKIDPDIEAIMDM